MESINSLMGFFYNFIPGVLFVFGLDFYLHFLSICSISNKGIFTCSLGAEKIIPVLILGIFFGFLMQGISKLIKMRCLNKCIFRDTIDKDPDSFSLAISMLIKRKLIGKKEKGAAEKIFYMMDNYIKAVTQAAIIEHFAAKAAFWLNISLTVIILAFISLMTYPYPIFGSSLFIWMVIILFSAIFSFKLFLMYSKNHYDVVLKTFVSIMKIDKKL